MNKEVYKLTPEIWLDQRRAVWLPTEEVLIVSDLHIGYAWAHRHDGQLLPLTVPDDTLPRLLELTAHYRPQEIVLLGDVIHRSVPVPALQQELIGMLATLGRSARVTLITGNHDRGLKLLLARTENACRICSCATVGSYLLCHGDSREALRDSGMSSTPRRIFIGHEHPAVTLGDGVASWVRCPCFLVSDTVVVLPAFSRWASGTVFGSHPLMSPLAREASFRQAVAIAGERLLAMPL